MNDISAAFTDEIQERSGAPAGAVTGAAPAHSSAHSRLAAGPTATRSLAVGSTAPAAAASFSASASASSAPAPSAAAAAAPPAKLSKFKARMMGLDPDDY